MLDPILCLLPLSLSQPVTYFNKGTASENQKQHISQHLTLEMYVNTQ